MPRSALLLVLLALTLAGCGGDEAAAPEAVATEATESTGSTEAAESTEATDAADAPVEDLANVLQLRSDFEADAGKTRAIVLLSPT